MKVDGNNLSFTLMYVPLRVVCYVYFCVFICIFKCYLFSVVLYSHVNFEFLNVLKVYYSLVILLNCILFSIKLTDAKQLKLDDWCGTVPVRKFFTTHGEHQTAPELSQDTPLDKEIVKPTLDKKVTVMEKKSGDVRKIDEILRLDYNTVETTIKNIKQAPEDLELQKNIIDTPSGIAFQAKDEILTSEYKSVETTSITKKAPDSIKSQENTNLTYSPTTSIIEAADGIEPSQFKNVETDKIIKDTTTDYVEAKDEILTSAMKKGSDIGESQRNNVNIIDTPEGNIAMEVENTFLDNLEKKLVENPNPHVYLRELHSGQLIVDFEPQENVFNLKVQVTKSPSGEIQFVLFKNLSSHIRPCESCESVCEQSTNVETLILKVVRSECKLKRTLTDCKKVCYDAENSMLEKRLAIKRTAKMERENIRKFVENQILNIIPKESQSHSCRSTDKENNTIELYKEEIDMFYDNNKGEIKLNVHGANGAKACISANLTRTLSGDIAMNVRDMNYVGVFADSSKECPVLLKKSPSGAYILYVGYQKPDHKPNTILKRSASGQMLIVITEPVLKSFLHPTPPLQEIAKEKLYKVRVKNASSRTTTLPAFLKMTKSENFVLILDKEFEKQFNNHIMKYLNDYSQCYIELQKTASDTMEINFDTKCTENAILVKTPSGYLRILVNGEEYNSVSQTLFKVDSNKSAKAFDELLRQIHTLSLPGCSQSKNKAETSLKKQSSDSQLLDSDKNSHLTNSNRPIKIQKTSSGQYAVVLEKNSKKALLTDLNNYLNVNTKGLVPVRKMGSGDIMIILDPEGQSTDLYGSLTITPSGNVYVTMDENVLKALSNAPSGMTGLGSHHIIKKVKHPENKGVDTNCSAYLDACLCHPSCICSDLLACVDKSGNSQDIKCGYLHKTKKILRRNLPCNPSKCFASCCIKNTFTRTNVRENQICECLNPSYSEQRNVQQCYCLYDSVCTINENLSSEILAAISPCSETDNMSSSETLDDSVEEFTSFSSNISIESCKYDWDYLPPQLPPFLTNFNPVVIT